MLSKNVAAWVDDKHQHPIQVSDLLTSEQVIKANDANDERQTGGKMSQLTAAAQDDTSANK